LLGIKDAEEINTLALKGGLLEKKFF